MQKYRANGKLLLTGEYLVLDGAIALSLPTQAGQTLELENQDNAKLDWRSLDYKDKTWFEFTYTEVEKEIINNPIAERLRQVLLQAKEQNPAFLQKLNCRVTSKLEFPENWGLGSSSTLIHLIAQWANCNPFELLFKTFGGSGYDIASAGSNKPVLYRLIEKKLPDFQTVDFIPPFNQQLYFIYLGKKQNSRTGIKHFREKGKYGEKDITEISNITQSIIQVKELNEFEKLIAQHEKIISRILSMTPVQKIYFSDYWGQIKSLGAWGGDFVLATSGKSYSKTKKYFNEKGFDVFLKYEDMIIKD